MRHTGTGTDTSAQVQTRIQTHGQVHGANGNDQGAGRGSVHVCMPSAFNAVVVGLWAVRAAAVCLHWARTTVGAHSTPAVTHCPHTRASPADVSNALFALTES